MNTRDEIKTARRVGILGTVIFHLVLAILLIGRGISRVEKHDGMEITLALPDQEALQQRVEELRQQEERLRESAAGEVRELLRSIAVNEEIAATASPRVLPVEQEIERYIATIREELRVKAGGHAATRDPRHDEDSLQALASRRQREQDSLQSTVYAGESSVSYRLAGRYKTRLPVPVFRRASGGTVVVSIEVNPRGVVVKARVVDAESGDDERLREVALEAATCSRFNEDEQAAPRQRGTITYHFVSQ